MHECSEHLREEARWIASKILPQRAVLGRPAIVARCALGIVFALLIVGVSRSSALRIGTSLRNVLKSLFSSSKIVVHWPLAISFTTT